MRATNWSGGFQTLSTLFFWISLAIGASSTITKSQHFQRDTVTILEDYEYIVVGSGPGGGPLAARLALNGYKTLLIEAGDDHGTDIEYEVPAFQAIASEYEPMRWNFWVKHFADEETQARDSKTTWTTPDGTLYTGTTPPEGSTMKGILYPRAGTLGGCSSHNAMITIYPHESDWEYLANITGDESWGPANMRKYFERIEDATYLLGNSIVGHGFSGWLTVGVTDLTLILQDSKLLQMVVAIATAFGQTVLSSLLTTVTGLASVLLLDINADTATRDQLESPYQVPISIKDYARNGARDHLVEIYNSGKYPLDIRMNCLVTKVRFNGTRAVGVDFLDGQSLYRADTRASSTEDGGTPGQVNATREVILSGGVYNTPQLLKLSGVGPKAELESFGIPVIKDSPGVGTNLQDRYEIGTTVKFDSNFTISEDCTWNNLPDPCLEKWESNTVSRGLYGSNGLAISAVRKSSVAAADDPADLMVLGFPANFRGYFLNYSIEVVADSMHWTWLTLKAHSRNRAGTVKLTSTDPRDTPDIVFNSFQEGGDEDVQAVYEGVEFSRKIYDSLLPTVGSYEDVRPPSGEAATKQFIRDEAWGHHASCTCPIGADDDPNAVLDGNFKVRGVDGLRVVDASAMPLIPGYFIVSSVYMMSEKAADVIMADAGNSSAKTV